MVYKALRVGHIPLDKEIVHSGKCSLLSDPLLKDQQGLPAGDIRNIVVTRSEIVVYSELPMQCKLKIPLSQITHLSVTYAQKAPIIPNYHTFMYVCWRKEDAGLQKRAIGQRKITPVEAGKCDLAEATIYCAKGSIFYLIQQTYNIYMECQGSLPPMLSNHFKMEEKTLQQIAYLQFMDHIHEFRTFRCTGIRPWHASRILSKMACLLKEHELTYADQRLCTAKDQYFSFHFRVRRNFWNDIEFLKDIQFTFAWATYTEIPMVPNRRYKIQRNLIHIMAQLISVLDREGFDGMMGKVNRPRSVHIMQVILEMMDALYTARAIGNLGMDCERSSLIKHFDLAEKDSILSVESALLRCRMRLVELVFSILHVDYLSQESRNEFMSQIMTRRSFWDRGGVADTCWVLMATAMDSRGRSYLTEAKKLPSIISLSGQAVCVLDCFLKMSDVLHRCYQMPFTVPEKLAELYEEEARWVESLREASRHEHRQIIQSSPVRTKPMPLPPSYVSQAPIPWASESPIDDRSDGRRERNKLSDVASPRDIHTALASPTLINAPLGKNEQLNTKRNFPIKKGESPCSEFNEAALLVHSKYDRIISAALGNGYHRLLDVSLTK